jgi:hypothetical protein
MMLAAIRPEATLSSPRSYCCGENCDERECRLPQSKESCRKIEQALLTAVNTSALIIHCCSRLIVMITLIAAAALIASYLFFTVIFT